MTRPNCSSVIGVVQRRAFSTLASGATERDFGKRLPLHEIHEVRHHVDDAGALLLRDRRTTAAA